MTRLATAPYPGFAAWDDELKRSGPSYTVETVEAIVRARASDSFVLVVGADTWPEIPSWREPERLLSLVEVAVERRIPIRGRADAALPGGARRAPRERPGAAAVRHRDPRAGERRP
jgi:nicotinate-nucleotide adenylyltransferase